MPINTTFFQHSHTRKIITSFGTLFNNITILRENGKETKVPILYGNKEKFYRQRKEDSEHTRAHAITYPRMSFIVSSFIYDSVRKISSKGKRRLTKDEQTDTYVWNSVPYNINIDLSITARSLTDVLQIVEQIIPYFKPSFVVTMTELTEPPVKRDIPITLVSVDPADTSDGGFEDTRINEWNLSFEIEANFFGPVNETGLIKEVFVDTYMAPGDWDQKSAQFKGTPNPTTANKEDEWSMDEEWVEPPDTIDR